jgi:hypothetical protein
MVGGRVLPSYSPDPKARVAASVKIRDGRKKITDLPGFYVRGIDHEVPDRGSGEEFFTVVTTILNPEEANAVELAAAYHERWEIEVTFDEVKTHQRGPGAILRSMSPEMITQELWELLLTHYCVRKLMTEAADQADIDPDRLSFIRSLRVVRRQVTSQAAFSQNVLLRRYLKPLPRLSSVLIRSAKIDQTPMRSNATSIMATRVSALAVEG